MTDGGPAPTEEVTPQKQRDLYKQVGYKKPQVGEIWYAISAKWYKAWITYTAYNKKDEDIEGGLEQLHLRDVPRPGSIDNSELADPEDISLLKKELEEHLTHEWVHSEQWKLLHSWYGGGPEFPRQVYERGSTYSREKYINMYPRFLKFVEVNSDGTYDITKPTAQAFPEHHTWREVVSKFEGLPEGEESEKPTVHLWLPFEHMKKVYPVETGRGVVVTLDDLQSENPQRYVETPDDQLNLSLGDTPLSKDVVILVERKRGSQIKKKGKNEGEQEDDEGEDNNKAPKNTEDGNKPEANANKAATESSDEEKFPWPLVKGPNKWKEFQAGDVLDAQDSQKKWYEAYIRYVGKEGTPNAGKAAVHFIGWASKWDEWVEIGNYERFALRHSHTEGKPHRAQQKKSYMGGGGFSWYDSNERGSPQQKGVVGLCNLGNTCFMNSTIQCLAQSPYLTDYFLRGDFVHHINHNNPLGWKGKVAEAWAHLLKDMFSNQYRVVAPRDFKTAIGEVAPRFMGYSQQDSQELLSFLLDGLHEDLNQIQQKPPTDPVESNGRPDEVVAAEAWRAYLKRNVSIVVDLLQGQYKSRVECPDCDRVSITFDPYMFLSVPLPTERYKVMEFTWVGTDPEVPPTVHGIKMLKVADIAMFKKAVAKQFNIPSADDLYVCDVWKSKIHRELKNRDMIAEINRRNDDIVVFYAPKPNEPVPSTEKEKEKETTEDKDKDKDKENANKDKDNAKRKNRSEGEFDDEDDDDYYGQSGGRGKDNTRGGYQPVVPDFKTFHIWCQTRVQVRASSYSSQYREENELIGMPLMVTLPMKRKVSHREAREKIFSLVRPYLVNKDKWTTSIGETPKSDQTENQDEKDKKKDNEFPFAFWATYGHNSVLALEDKEDATVPLGEYGFRFVLLFPNRAEYNEEVCIREKRARAESAPPPLNRNSYDDDDRTSDKAVPLSTCIDAFTEEEILDENDAWYCSKCSAFKCAKKKIDLWSAPDLLIIHLKRFSYTRQWRDRINTVVQFPLEGFDLSPWIVSEEYKRDAIYDLYGISNHMGSMGGGHYTAYAKNLENGKWYELDDSRTSEIRDVESMVSSSAYVLYYQRRKPRQLKQRASRVVVPITGSTQTESTKLPTTTEEGPNTANEQ